MKEREGRSGAKKEEEEEEEDEGEEEDEDEGEEEEEEEDEADGMVGEKGALWSCDEIDHSCDASIDCRLKVKA